ncbi:MAG TPA: HpsJ family protein [Candidatus Caenarcaniphilales bacterium]
MDSRQTPVAAQVLNLVGVVLILSLMVEFLVLLISPEFSNQQWQLGVMTQLVDRGVTPLVGFALIYTAFWIQGIGTSQTLPGERGTWQNPRFWAFVISSLLGLLFLLLIPLYFSTTGVVSQQALSSINQQASQAELQIEQQQNQLRTIVANKQLDQLINSNQVPPDQLPLLQKLKQDPQALDKEAERARTEIRTKQRRAQSQAQAETLRSRLRNGLRSLLLAIGYITIGWSGLREAS